MGQTLGRAPLPKGSKRFLNLPKKCIYELWEAFNDIAEGFGLTIEEFQEIIKSGLMEYLNITERMLNVDTEAAFRLFDDDENNLVDSLEFLSSFALLSGMTPEEKIRYIFAMYDFDESGVLSVDEMVLAFRSTLSGLSKLSKIDPPTETEIETIVVLGFDSIRKTNGATDTGLDYKGIDREDFVLYCLNTPEILSWIEYFDDLEEYQIALTSRIPITYPTPSHTDRTNQDEACMNVSLGGFKLLEYERKGDIVVRKNWQNVMPFLAPTRKVEAKNRLPDKNVKLEWVYGFNGHSARQCLYYSAKGEAVYAAGATCIVQSINHHDQKYFIEHTDLVTCLKLYHQEDGNTVVASGECGTRPAIHVWDCESRKIIVTFQGFHRNGIKQLDFSPDREKLVSLGMDPYHSVAVHSLVTKLRIWSSRSTNVAVHDVRFLNRDTLATCGVDHVNFWKESKPAGIYKRYRGHFGTAVKPETLWCVGVVGKTVFTGSDTGMVYIWEGRNLISSIKGHTGAIYACHVVKNGEDEGLVTACSMGKVLLWNSKMELGATFNAAALGAIEAPISSICYDMQTSKILIGFNSCEVFEMDATDGRNIHNGGSIIAGHFHPRVCGITNHPTQARYFATVGDDKSVRIFDCILRKQLRVSVLDSKGHCVSYSKDGLVLIIGIGTGIEGQEERKEGAFVALSEEDLTLLHECRDSKSLIADCKYSPNGETFALASHDGSLYIYNAKKYIGQAKCRGHSGKVERVDYSANSGYLMSNCSGGDLLFWDVTTGELQQPKSIKATQWETNSCTATFATQGIWNFHVDDGTKYNAAFKSNAQDIIGAVDNYGRLRVGIYPCTEDNACLVNCYGHAKQIENCVITCDDSRIFTTGGTDGSIFQWRVSTNEVQNLNDLKKDETIGEVIPMEMKFEGRMLERSANYENVINCRPVAISDLEEGKVDVSAMMPWHKTIVGPSRVPTEDNSEPSDVLELEYVYGFSMDISRQALMYAPNGSIVFFSAGVAVVMNQKLRTQRFYNQHNATITAMAVNRVDGVIATGDQGEVPTIRIWTCETMETVSILEGFHRRAICHLKFSVDGKLLITVGHDSNHRLALYDWRNKQIVANAVSFDMKSLFIDFNPNGTGLIQCGNEIIRFWDFEGRNMFFQDAILGSRAKQQGFLCAGWIGSSAVVGTTDGNLYRFLGNKLDSIVQAHASAVNSIAYTADGLCSAGADGYIKVWTRFLECRLVIELKRLMTVNNVVRCIDWDYDVGRIIFGTASAEIFEIGAGDGENLHKGALLEGHGGEELWGLAVNPVKDEFCTVGDDAFLRVWNILSHTTEMTVTLEMPARCCAFSPDGKQLAIGFGCPKKLSNRQFDGKWVVLDTEDYQVSHEARDSTKWITDIKYSPNGELIAMGSHDNKIYVYSVPSGYALNACINQHQSFITGIDFSDDSQWLMSNCGGFELCFFEADTGLFIPAASRLRDTVWSTHNCTMAWAVQGIWPPQKDGTEMVSCDINLFRGEDGTVIAAGDNYGRIRLFRYPCTSAFAISKVYWPSSNPVTRLRFMSGDAYLISISALDKTIFQWSHRRDRDAGVAFDVLDRRSKLEEEDDDVMTLFGLAGAQELIADPNDMAHLVSTRPWLSSIVAPSNATELIAGRPLKEGLEMSHILGLQCDLTRLSVRFNTFGDVIYPCSKYACVYNKKTNSQIYYTGHANEMSCVAVSECGMFVASAERCDRPSIHIWDATTCGSIVVLPYLHRKGVISMQFSSDKKFLVSLGQDDDHSIALWISPSGQWTDGKLFAWTKGDVNPALFVCFYEENLGANNYLLASGGRFHQKFWKLDGRCINANYAEYDKKIKLGTLLCGAKVGGKFVSGSTTGHIYVWTGRKLDRSIRAHELGVTCLWSCKLGVVSSAKDGIVKLWSLDFEHIRSFSLRESDVPPVMSSVRSLDCYLSPGKEFINLILVTTAGGEVYEIAAKSGSICLLHEAHYGGQLWGLCVHPTDPDVFATTGDDRTIRVWSISTRRLLRKAVIDCSARSISWSPNGNVLVVGMGGLDGGKRQRKDGAYLLLDSATMRPIYEGRDSRHWIADVKFAPDGKSFAVASMDHKIYIYNADTYRLKGTCDRHNSHVIGFDYSVDSMYIQSDAADYEHLYFEAQDGEYFSAGSQLKDIKWSDWTCVYGWPVQGVWPYFADIENKTAFEPTAVHRSPDQNLLVCGDQSGAVKLYKYPCVNKEASVFKAQAHVKEVSKVRFTCDGKNVISLGRQDRSIIIWKVLPMGGSDTKK